jgi:hypothetical protein
MGISEKELRPDWEFSSEERKQLAAAIRLQDPALRTAFEEAKNALIKATPLTAIDNTRPLYIITDASRAGWGSVVTHDPSGNAPPVAWLSGSFTKAELGWHSIHREIFALVASLRRYPDLFGITTHPIQVLTDSEHLVQWTSLDITSARLSGWNEILSSFNLRLAHLPGDKNIVADALSRH